MHQNAQLEHIRLMRQLDQEDAKLRLRECEMDLKEREFQLRAKCFAEVTLCRSSQTKNDTSTASNRDEPVPNAENNDEDSLNQVNIVNSSFSESDGNPDVDTQGNEADDEMTQAKQF